MIKQNKNKKNILLSNYVTKLKCLTNKKQQQFNDKQITTQISLQIKSKIKTFRNWDCRTQLIKRKKSQQHSLSILQTKPKNIYKNIFQQILQQNTNKSLKKKNHQPLQQLQGVKQQRKQRLKRTHNPILIIKHYMTKQGHLPTPSQNILMQQIIKIKQKIDTMQPFNLTQLLHDIYKIMNLTAQLKQIRFLMLLIIMTGEICFGIAEYKTAFFFFNNVLLACNYTKNWGIKTEALSYMGKIAMEISQYQKAIIFFKKALQYAWKIKDSQSQLKLYDLIGKSYYYDGLTKKALYYHNRYILGQLQQKDSAIKTASIQILKKQQQKIDNTQQQNLIQFLLQYLMLPIGSSSNIGVITKTTDHFFTLPSYRKNKDKLILNLNDFPEVTTQINKILKQSSQFLQQIPQPDIHHNFIPLRQYGKHRKTIQFQHSLHYHKLTSKTIQLVQYDKNVLKLPISQQISKIIKQKPNDNWWNDILNKNKKQKQSKLGNLKNKIQKSHLSYHKYPQQRKKFQSLKTQKLNQAINKTLICLLQPSKTQE